MSSYFEKQASSLHDLLHGFVYSMNLVLTRFEEPIMSRANTTNKIR